MPKKPLIAEVAEYIEDQTTSGLLEIYRLSRGQGNTSAIMKVAQECNSLVVFATNAQAFEAKKEYPNVNCVSIMGLIHVLGNPPRPILFDNSVWPVIFERLEKSRDLLKRAKYALEMISQVRRTLLRIMGSGDDLVEM